MEPQEIEKTNQQRHFLAVFFLSFMWGSFGVDRFYLGKVWTGILKLISFGGFGLWVIIDLVLIMSGAMKDKQGKDMLEFERYKSFAVKTVAIFAVVLGAMMLISGGIMIYLIYEIANRLLEGTLSGGGLTQDLPLNLIEPEANQFRQF